MCVLTHIKTILPKMSLMNLLHSTEDIWTTHPSCQVKYLYVIDHSLPHNAPWWEVDIRVRLLASNHDALWDMRKKPSFTSSTFYFVMQLIAYFTLELFGKFPGLPGLFTSAVFSGALRYDKSIIWLMIFIDKWNQVQNMKQNEGNECVWPKDITDNFPEPNRKRAVA